MRQNAQKDGEKAPLTRMESAQVLLESIIPYQINRLTFRMNQLLNKDLRAHGLSISNWRVLAVLDHNSEATVNELAAYAMIEQSTLSRMLRRMELDGLLQSHVGANDGRVRSISLTEAGKRKYDEVRAVTLAHTARIVHGLTAQERSVLRRQVSMMLRNVETLDLDMFENEQAEDLS